MPRLIVNADDFGLTPGVNRAIVEAHQRGVVTSTTLMANARAFDDAVRLARQHPTLAVGCHVVLVDGNPLLPPQQVPSLISAKHHDEFRRDFKSFVSAALRGRMNSDDVERETAAQIRKLQDAGIDVTHIDSHKHAHMFPGVLAPMLRAAAACGVRRVRNPFVPARPLAMAHVMRRPKLWTRFSQVKLLRRLRKSFHSELERMGMISTDGSFGVLTTGVLDATLFEAIVSSIPEGTWEFVCHPGHDDADLDKVRTRLRDSRPQELAVLTSKDARQAIEGRVIELISYRDLVAAKTESPVTSVNQICF